MTTKQLGGNLLNICLTMPVSPAFVWTCAADSTVAASPHLPRTVRLIPLERFDLLETVQRTWRSHASNACSIHSTELDFRDVESNGGGLQPGLHHFQRTCQNSSHCTATSRAKLSRSGKTEGKNKAENGGKSMSDRSSEHGKGLF